MGMERCPLWPLAGVRLTPIIVRLREGVEGRNNGVGNKDSISVRERLQKIFAD